jgi:hypothetical protein
MYNYGKIIIMGVDKMDVDFKIRGVALKLLSYIYLKCDANLEVKDLELSSLLEEKISKYDISKAIRYLMGKKFIETRGISVDNFSCTMLANGVDWVEEFNNVEL